MSGLTFIFCWIENNISKCFCICWRISSSHFFFVKNWSFFSIFHINYKIPGKLKSQFLFKWSIFQNLISMCSFIFTEFMCSMNVFEKIFEICIPCCQKNFNLTKISRIRTNVLFGVCIKSKKWKFYSPMSLIRHVMCSGNATDFFKISKSCCLVRCFKVVDMWKFEFVKTVNFLNLLKLRCLPLQMVILRISTFNGLSSSLTHIVNDECW